MMNQTVHAGLRRDIRRFKAAFADPSPPAEGRREAMADHVGWLADFLHEHHTGEDTAVWPRVRAKAPELTPLVDRLEGEHQAMTQALTALEKSAAAWRSDGSEAARSATSSALDTFAVVCVGHLDYEEQEAMPQVAAVLDDDDWSAISKVMRGSPPMSEAGFRLMWMLDDLDAEHTAVVEGVIPKPVMWFLRRRFGPRYAARRTEIWGANPAA